MKLFRAEKRRIIEEENLFLRRFQIEQELEKQVKLGQSKEDPDASGDIYERTKKFYQLKKQLAYYVKYIFFCQMRF